MHFLFVAIASLSAQAQLSAEGEARAPSTRPAVVEIFVSQACKASPPAADAVAELAADPGIVALTWHVDYWNAMAGKDGVWRDPFSSDLANARQRRYNERIRGRGMPITPQAVINGETSTVGNRIQALEENLFAVSYSDGAPVGSLAVSTGSGEAADLGAHNAKIEMYRADDGAIVATVSGNNAPYDALLVQFHPYTETNIESGDNAGDVFREVNTVVAAAPLGVSVDGAASFRFERPAEGQGCALLVQDPGQGRIIAAQYCP
jgi:hypothetical protein